MTGHEKLIKDLAAKPASGFGMRLLKLAKQEVFHDFHSPDDDEFACPKVRLVSECMDLGYHDIAARAKEGYYDDKPCATGTCKRCEEIKEGLEAILGKDQ